MRYAAFARAPLAMAVGAALSAPASAALFEEAAPSFTVRATGDDFAISGFDLTALPDDRFAVLWTETSIGRDRLLLQRFDVNGNALAAPLTVSEEAAASNDSMGWPSLAADDQGNLVASWHLQPEPTYSQRCNDSLLFRRISADDNLGTRVEVAAPGDVTCTSDVAVDDDGNVALTWPVLTSDMVLQRMATYDSNDGAMANEVVVDNTSEGQVALNDDGTLLVVWSSSGQTSRALGRRFALNGAALDDSPFQLDGGEQYDTLSVQRNPTVTAADDGGFATAWTDYRPEQHRD